MNGSESAVTVPLHLFGHALRKFWQHRDLLWSIYLMNAFLIFLRLFAGIYLIKSPAVDTVLNLLFNIFTTPVMVLGLSRVLLSVMRGGPVRLSMLLADFASLRTLKKALAAALIWQAPTFWITFLISVNIPQINTLGQVFLAVPLLVFGILAWLWLLLKLFLFPYLFVTRPEEKLRTLAKASFEAVRGKSWRTAGTYLASVWMVALLAVCLISLTGPMITHDAARASSLWLFYNGIITISVTLVGPYTGLAMAGYADRLLAKE